MIMKTMRILNIHWDRSRERGPGLGDAHDLATTAIMGNVGDYSEKYEYKQKSSFFAFELFFFGIGSIHCVEQSW